LPVTTSNNRPTRKVDRWIEAKAPTGIRGFDQITDGGLPRGRPTLVTEASGSGETLFGIEFLVRGAREW
jgi:circadian clock protein KaiC